MYVCMYIHTHIWIHKNEKLQIDTYCIINMCYPVDVVWGGKEK